MPKFIQRAAAKFYPIAALVLLPWILTKYAEEKYADRQQRKRHSKATA